MLPCGIIFLVEGLLVWTHLNYVRYNTQSNSMFMLMGNYVFCFVQGSVHTRPTLTCAEVLVIIHVTDPEKYGIPLKKACKFYILYFNVSYNLLIFLNYFVWCIIEIKMSIMGLFSGNRCLLCIFWVAYCVYLASLGKVLNQLYKF